MERPYSRGSSMLRETTCVRFRTLLFKFEQQSPELQEIKIWRLNAPTVWQPQVRTSLRVKSGHLVCPARITYGILGLWRKNATFFCRPAKPWAAPAVPDVFGQNKEP